MKYNTTKLTLELRDLVEQGINIWDFDYPSYYQGEEKTAFEQKVINHFYFRQIGQETVGRFLHYFKTRINEIMPYYKQLYESEALMHSIEDPFGNVNVTEEFTQTSTGSVESTNNGTTTSDSQSNGSNEHNNVHKFSNTPQGDISNLDNYMSEASQDVESDVNSSTSSGSVTNSDTGNQTSESTVKHTFTKKGNQGVNTYAHDMKELRQTFLNIDMMVIDELNTLFLGVY